MKTKIKIIACTLVMLICPGIMKAQNSSQNYIISRTFYTDTESKYSDEVQYYDGLGRPFQKIQKGATASGSNLIALQEYDTHGRPANAWLPIVSSSNYLAPATFKSQAPGNYASDSRPYSNPVYEASPLNRVTAQYGPGAAWNAKPVASSFNSNAESGNYRCTLYRVSATYVLTKDGNYPAGRLFVATTTDEDQNIVYTFKDKEDRVVLVRQMAGSEPHDTYYVYDDWGNLCYVLPPMMADDISTDKLNLYAYSYKYDNRNNCIEKKLPGATAIKYVYDQADKLIFSQDGVQAAKSPQEWTFYLYDKYKRLTVQGTCKNTNTATIAATIVACSFTPTNTGVGSSGYTANYTLTSAQVNALNYYDTYRFRSLTGFSDSNLQADTVNAQGMLTGSAVYLLETSTKLCSALYYDDKARLVKTLSNNHLAGGYEKTTTTYDFTGKPLTVQHVHKPTGDTIQTQLYTYTYNDPLERLTKVTHKLNTATAVTLVENTYDELGRLKSSQRNGQTALTTNYTYNIRSWVKSISTGNLFSQTLYYNDSYGGNKPRYNGNISAMTWTVPANNVIKGYRFAYDSLSRLTSADYLENGAANSHHNTSYTYDKHGNITDLTRSGHTGTNTYGIVDNLAMTYNGNQLIKVTDTGTTPSISTSADFRSGSAASVQYLYDANGNLKQDLNKGIGNIAYNSLNLPSSFTISNSLGSATNTYVYSADGRKLKVTKGTFTTDYCGNVIYENNVLKRILVDGGYYENGTYYFYLADHLGNNRVVANQSGSVVQSTQYYPFGMAFADGTNPSAQPYKFGGKELDSDRGLNLYDFHARWQDAALGGRFLSVDPLAEKYYSVSPYVYCMNNPVRFVDPDGRDWYWIDYSDEKKRSLQYDPNITKDSKLGENQKYAGETVQHGTGSYRKDGSIMFSNESNGYARIWNNSQKTGNEEMGVITDNGVLVLPSYKNGKGDVNLNDYEYSSKDGNIVDADGMVYNTIATVHTHPDGSGPSIYDGDGWGDLGFAGNSTPNKPVFVLQNDGKNTISVIQSAPTNGRIIRGFNQYTIQNITSGMPNFNIRAIKSGGASLRQFTKQYNSYLRGFYDK